MDLHLMEGLYEAREPRRHMGVYVLWDGKTPAYIGQSRNCLLRSGEHSSRITFDAWTYIPCDEDDLLPLERSLIELLQPIYNRCARRRRR